MGTIRLTGDNLIDGMTNGYYWLLGTERTIDWSMSNGLQGETWRTEAAAREYIGQILNNISQYANVRFSYVGFHANPAAAAAAGSEINFAWTGSLFSSPSQIAQGFFPRATSRYYGGEAGDVFFNPGSSINTAVWGPGTKASSIVIHEIGHALGLKHPHDNGGNGRPIFRALQNSSLDKDWATVMSYKDDYSWNTLSWNAATPMIMDVLALQYLYGKNWMTGISSDTYDLSRTGQYATIWDAFGTDTVSAAQQAEGWLIMLPESPFSRLVDTKVGFAMPISDALLSSPTSMYWLAGDYENATGSRGADLLLGNGFANRLEGCAGNDYIDGGDGIDTAVFSGTAAQYTITRTGDEITVRGADGVDTLTNVERAVIGSTRIALDIAGTGGQAYRLYQAAFNRTPDPSGLGYQMNALDTGTKLTQVANNFIASPEFRQTYGSLSDAQFVTQLYQNVLHRAPDSAGLSFHTASLGRGGARADVLIGFSESPENQAALIGVMSAGMAYA